MVKFSYWNVHLLAWNGERVVEVADLATGTMVDPVGFQRENNPSLSEIRSWPSMQPTSARELLDGRAVEDAASMFLRNFKQSVQTWRPGMKEDVGAAMRASRDEIVAKLDEWPALERRIRACLEIIRKKMEL